MRDPCSTAGQQKIKDLFPYIQVSVLHCLEVVPLALVVDDGEVILADLNIGYVGGFRDIILSGCYNEAKNGHTGRQILDYIAAGGTGGGVELTAAKHATEGRPGRVRELMSNDSHREGTSGKGCCGSGTKQSSIIINLKLDVVEPAQIESILRISQESTELHSQPDLIDSTGGFSPCVGHGPTMLEPEVPEEVMAGDMPAIIIAVADKADMLKHCQNIHINTGCGTVGKPDANIKSTVAPGLGKILSKQGSIA